jgi:hypothetical protein
MSTGRSGLSAREEQQYDLPLCQAANEINTIEGLAFAFVTRQSSSSFFDRSKNAVAD